MKEISFFIFLFYDSVNIYSFLTAIWLLQEGETGFANAYTSLFAIKKVVTLMIMIFTCQNWKYQLINFFQVGFIYTLCINQQNEDFQRIFEFRKIWTITQLMIWSIFICCLGKFEDRKIPSYAIIASLINFILIILLLITLQLVFYKPMLDFNIFISKKIEIISRQVVITLSYYVTIFSLTFYIDIFGLNLGYYQLIMMLLNYIIFIALICFNRIKMSLNLQLLYLYSCTLNIDFSFKHHVGELEINIISIINYFNSIIKISLLSAYSLKNFYELFEYQNQMYSQIRLGFVLSSIILTLIYILINVKEFIYFIIYSKYFNVECNDDLEKIKNKLNQNGSIKNYQICLRTQKQEEYDYVRLQNIDQQIILQFWQAVSFQLKLKNVIIIEGYSNYHIPIEIVHPYLQRQLEDQLNKEKYVDRQIFQRIDNGFIFNQFTFFLMKKLQYQQRTYFMLYIREILTINAYFNHISVFMLQHPAEVLYDLYNFDHTKQSIDLDFLLLSLKQLISEI